MANTDSKNIFYSVYNCRISDDYDIGDLITIGKGLTVEKISHNGRTFRYCYKNKGTKKEQFQVYYKQAWRDAHPIDFDK